MRLVLEAAVPGRRELVPLRQAAGRRLAEAITATTDWPPFARSGLDGFAVRSADTASASPSTPATLRVVSSVAAGELASAAVAPGTAVRIMTGGPVPPGADAVVMLEQTADAWVEGLPAVHVKRAAEPGQNIAPRGEEFRCGSVIAEPGTRLRPGHVALLGTFGYADVPVYARPRVAVLATGAELLPVEAALAPGCIRDSNSAMVAALVEQCGGEALVLARVPDEPEATARAIAEALAQSDLIITTGGVSVGDYDVIASLLRGIEPTAGAAESPSQVATGEAPAFVPAGTAPLQVQQSPAATGEPPAFVPAGTAPLQAQQSPAATGEAPAFVPADTAPLPDPALPQASRLLFNKVAMRPGSPTSAAVIDGKLLLALSGNPGACFVGFELFAKPAIQRLQGAGMNESLPKQVTAKLASPFDKGSPHERFVRTRLFSREGMLFADPLAFGKSSMMASIPEADGLIRLKASPEGTPADTIVDIILL
ncbi:molybdopterin molybdotransferase MoeA [Paenibacillus sp. BC26]|uniref:molybdopterin molybdotransferase MoeA n=1 Tax=Paenibacillus sp. BC26 TaxID=1881032 RepID=UPI00210BCF51|nr:molybdopterin-binding protein [Paenibacillus sp. BC26]